MPQDRRTTATCSYWFAALALVLTMGCSGKDSKAPKLKDAETSKALAKGKALPDTLVPSGSAACAECHQEIVQSFRESGKSRTLARPDEVFAKTSPARKSATVSHPELPIAYRAYVDESGRWWQEETVDGTKYSRQVEAHYTIGSSGGVRSFIARDPSQMTLLPLSWSNERTQWELTEGFKGSDQPRFIKKVSAECVSCHGGLNEGQAQLEPLGCGHCHGDGAQHIALRRGKAPVSAGADPMTKTVKMARRAAEATCERCHLEGVVRFRGDGAAGEVATYVDRASGVPSEAATRGERLAMSACAKASGEALTCVTCHSPHSQDAARAQRQACVGCHTSGKAECPDPKSKSPESNCAGCHMKNQGAVPEVHQGYTDHRISRPSAQTATDTETVGKVLTGVLGVPSEERSAKIQQLVATVLLGVEDNYRGTLLIPGTEALSAALGQDSTLRHAWEVLGRGYNDIGERKKTIEALGVAIGGPQPSLDLFLLLGQAYAEDGNFAAATRVLVTTLERYPKSGLAWGRLGGMLQRQGNFPEAEDAYAKAVKLFPKDSGLWSNRAYNQLEAKSMDRAIELFKRAHALDPLNFDASVGLADVYISKRRLRDAKVLMVEALRLDKRQVGVHINLGRIAFIEEDYRAAAQHFDIAIRLASHDPMLYVERARVAEAAGDIEGARRVIEQGRQRINTFEHWDKFLPKVEEAEEPTPTGPTPAP